MKSKLKYTLVAFTIVFQISCKDYLEFLPPGGLIREEFWQAKEDVQSVLMAAYSEFSALDREMFVFGEVRADMLEGDNQQNQQEELLMEGNVYPDRVLYSWEGWYRVINYCNEVIANAIKVQQIDDTFTDFERKGFEAEAYFLRSLAYFYLVRLYKEVPLVLVQTESDDADFYIPKSSEETVLNQIVSDLEANVNFAPSGGFKTIAENKGRASKASFYALLADIELWRFNYEDVINHVEKIEANKEIILMDTPDWFDIFYPGNSFEGIFELQFDNELDQRNSLYGLTQRNSNQYIPSQKAIEMFSFEFATELVRGEDVTIKKYGEEEYIVWKYVGQLPDGNSVRSSVEQNSANWIVYRLADVLLMKAEALSQLERFNEAYNLLEVIWERADVPSKPIANTPVSYEDAILEERALELAYEGKRWFDLMRMGRRNNYARKDKLIEIIITNVPSIQKRILAAKLTNPLGWYLPIFEDEIERNRALVQNPYYDF